MRFRILDWTFSTSRDVHRRINKQSERLAIFVRRISNVIIRDEVSE
jgi:hypothetical protein